MDSTSRKTTRDILVLVLFILVCEGAGAAGAILTDTGQSSWYQNLAKPSFNPPSWVFAPVWTVLYLMMAVAAFLVWRRRGPGRGRALALFALQLALNAIWTPVFFGLQNPAGAFVIIVLLLLAILATIAAFWSVSRWASLLLLPYLAWVAFATVLNGSIVMLNR